MIKITGDFHLAAINKCEHIKRLITLTGNFQETEYIDDQHIIMWSTINSKRGLLTFFRIQPYQLSALIW